MLVLNGEQLCLKYLNPFCIVRREESFLDVCDRVLYGNGNDKDVCKKVILAFRMGLVSLLC